MWFSPATPVTTTNKADRHDINDILLKGALITTTLTLRLTPKDLTPCTNTNLVIISYWNGGLFSGGTADITVHEQLSNDRLKELCRASDGDCGGTSVDNAFYQIFAKLVGAPLLNAMKRKHPEEYLYIFREFEAVKRTVYTDKDDKVKMEIPRTFLDNICKKHLKKDFNAVVRSSLTKIRLYFGMTKW